MPTNRTKVTRTETNEEYQEPSLEELEQDGSWHDDSTTGDQLENVGAVPGLAEAKGEAPDEQPSGWIEGTSDRKAREDRRERDQD